MNVSIDAYNDLDALDQLLKPASASEPLSFADDPIAMAVSAYRCRAGQVMMDIQAATVTDEDRVRAQEIRNHYHRRFTFQLLTNSGRLLSEFQRKLMGIVAGTHAITQDDMGILYRIPFFYEEDLAVDQVIESSPKHPFDSQPFIGRTDRFELVSTISVERKFRSGTHFWLRASSTATLCKIAVTKDNPLRELLGSVLSLPDLELTANWHPKFVASNHQQFNHYQLSAVKLSTGAHFG